MANRQISHTLGMKDNNTADGFPSKRMRRLRKNQGLRAMVRENNITKNDLILPIFVEENIKERSAIKSLPGVYRESEASLAGRVKEIYSHGINTIMLFGVSHNKDHNGTDSLKMDGLFSRMIQEAKSACPEIQVIADICLCEYTDHGHCGPLGSDGAPDNDKTLSIIAEQAIIAARSGADIMAPSGMMDGMIASLRGALDISGYHDIPLLSYAVKYASSHYGPFREAAGCSLGQNHAQTMQSDRKAYQMDPANAMEALREAALDIQEGADMLMVKPGLPYLDIIKSVKDKFQMPTFAYHVSGEYAMLKAAAQNGWLDYDNTIMEQMICFKRAGADGIVTYASMDIAQMLDR